MKSKNQYLFVLVIIFLIAAAAFLAIVRSNQFILFPVPDPTSGIPIIIGRGRGSSLNPNQKQNRYDIPQYPNSSKWDIGKRSDEYTNYTITFVTIDSRDKVMTWYHDELIKNGWSNDRDDGFVFYYSKTFDNEKYQTNLSIRAEATQFVIYVDLNAPMIIRPL